MKIKIIAPILLLSMIFSSCKLDYEPTDSGSGADLIKDASTAITIINGVYRSMWTAGWSTEANTHQCFGISAYNIALECMGDDFIMQSMGNGWFWYDHCYNVKAYYDSKGFRPYDVWYANYVWISNANTVISAAETMAGDAADKAYVLGQAYAIRALAYYNLANWFSRPAYNAIQDKYRWEEKCVPIYTEPSDKSFEGKARASIKEVYEQIFEDLDTALAMLEKGEGSVLDAGKSHMNKYVVNALKVRACLSVGDWETALSCAETVIVSGKYSIGDKSSIMNGMNDIEAGNVMWGAGIINSEQSGAYASFFTHMDNTDGAYAQSAPKLISSSLYKQMASDDIRRSWWDPSDETSPYVSRKFRFSNVSGWLGDYIYMRVEEMYFDAAEASLRLGDEVKARKYLDAVMSKRSNNFNSSVYSGTALGSTTNSWTGSLLECILVQKRIELWGEFGRLIDIRRLGQGISRKLSDGFSEDCLTTMSVNGVDLSSADTYDWILTIPQDELNANPNINAEDQNP